MDSNWCFLHHTFWNFSEMVELCKLSPGGTENECNVQTGIQEQDQPESLKWFHSDSPCHCAALPKPIEFIQINKNSNLISGKIQAKQIPKPVWLFQYFKNTILPSSQYKQN